MEARRGRVRVVESRNAEIDRLRLVIHLHQEWRSAFAAEVTMAETGGGHRLHLLAALGPHEIAVGNACEDHPRGAAAELAGAAMAPSGIKRIALQFIADRVAHTS